jgi:hypothetical protein
MTTEGAIGGESRQGRAQEISFGVRHVGRLSFTEQTTKSPALGGACKYYGLSLQPWGLIRFSGKGLQGFTSNLGLGTTIVGVHIWRTVLDAFLMHKELLDLIAPKEM